jgi:SPP1 gp7 family putative phage head morphogenesis protein
MPVDLGFATTLPPAKAIEYFESKGYVIGFNWHDVEDSAHATAFTVAGILKQDVLADVQQSLTQALKNGQTLAQFQASILPTLERKGWVGSGLKANPETGELEGKKLMPYRMETIFRTNMQSSYAAGRYQRMMENVAFRPYWEYDAIMDNRTRPAHAALNGRVFRYDDPIWTTIYPPNGYRCRCGVRARNERELEDHPIGLESSEDRMEWIDQPYGTDNETRRVQAYRDPKTGNVFTPDPGFHSNPGKGYMANLGDQLMRKGDTIDPRLAAQAVEEVMGQPRMIKEVTRDLASWAQQAHADTAMRGEWRYPGALKPAMLDALATQPLSAVIRLEGATVQDAVLSPEWLKLPELLSAPDVVLALPDNSGFIYVIQKPTSGTPRICHVSIKDGIPVVTQTAALMPGDVARYQHLNIVTGAWADE